MSLRDLESLEDSDTEDFSQSETVGFFEEALEKADGAEPRGEQWARNVPQFFSEKSVPMLLWLRVTKWNRKQSTKSSKVTIGVSGTGQGKKRSRHSKTRRPGTNLVRPPTYRDVILSKWVYKVKLVVSGQVDKNKARYVAEYFNKLRDWTTLGILRLPVSQRHSGFYFNYQRSRAMGCTSWMSRGLSCTH